METDKISQDDREINEDTHCFCSFGFTQLDRCTLANDTEKMRHRVVATAETMRMI